jgi:murein DD-endopeptidase MepM/ murein hydrolase activator NlpD
MESANNISGGDKRGNNDNSRRAFIKKIGVLGASAFISPLVGAMGESSSGESENDPKYESYITDEINEIKDIITNNNYEKILSNPYLAYTLYYSQEFLDTISNVKNQRHVYEKITGKILPFITPEFRKSAMLYFEKKTKDEENSENKKILTNEVVPLKNFRFGEGKGHKNAIDLFTKELSPVFSMGGGLVLIAENGWSPDNELSTSTMLGGNTVVVYNYLTKEFYRYAHLNEARVKSGKLITEGEKLGSVGHSGANAVLLGHGEHLHFEINKYLYDKNINQPISSEILKERLEKLK